MKQYYVENMRQGCVGNCLLWWRKKGAGYGCDIAKAEVFDEDSPRLIEIAKDDKKYRIWEKTYIDGLTTRHVDHQDLNWDLAGIRKDA